MNGGNDLPRGFCFTVSSSGSVFAESRSDLELELSVPRTGEARSTYGGIADSSHLVEVGKLSSVLSDVVYQEKGWLSVLTP